MDKAPVGSVAKRCLSLAKHCKRDCLENVRTEAPLGTSVLSLAGEIPVSKLDVVF